jgi:BASS family bile acid:Na+ symporter
LLVNFVAVPLFAYGIARLLRLDPPFAIGLLLLGLAPGAPFLPKVAVMAKGDLAFAVGLMVLLMTVSVVFLPLVLPLLLEGVKVDALRIARSLVFLMLGPLIAGLILRPRMETVAARLRPVLAIVANASLFTVVVLVIALNLKSLVHVFGTGAIFAAIVFNLIAALAGYLVGGSEAPRRNVLALGTGFRNIAAALVVAKENFENPQVEVMLVVVVVASLCTLIPVARRMGKRAATGPIPALAPDPPASTRVSR